MNQILYYNNVLVQNNKQRSYSLIFEAKVLYVEVHVNSCNLEEIAKTEM